MNRLTLQTVSILMSHARPTPLVSPQNESNTLLPRSISVSKNCSPNEVWETFNNPPNRSQKLPNQCHSAKFWMNHLLLVRAKLATPLSPFHRIRIIYVGCYSNQYTPFPSNDRRMYQAITAKASTSTTIF